jgi:hypothetical protein
MSILAIRVPPEDAWARISELYSIKTVMGARSTGFYA